jgi:alkylhydroperoxidase/carboxymuconolactone decarboxylase family protein YurZ
MRRYAELVERLRKAVLHEPGEIDPGLRQAIAARSAELAGLPAVPPGAPAGIEIPANLRELVDKAALHAYRITDKEVAALRRAGYSEDAIFEIAISVAIGGGLSRLERGLAALEGDKR